MAEQGRRLDSWKEIAEYLGRDVRTVMRWAKDQGLPVGRVGGGRGRSVFAYTADIDAWLAGHPQTQSTEAEIPPPPPPKLRPGWLVIAAGSAVLIVGAIGYTQFRPEEFDAGSLRAEMTASTLFLRDGKGRSRAIHHVDPALQAELTMAEPRVHDVDADGNRDVMVGVAFYLDPHVRTNSGGEVLNIGLDGRIRWRFMFDDVLSFRSESFNGPWGLADWSIGPAASPALVAVAGHDMVWWASVVTVVDHNGQRRGTFVHPGWIESLVWLDGNRLAAGGFSNERDAAVVAILDPAKMDGQAPGTAGTPYECAGCAPGTPSFYAYFPRSEINRLTASRFNRARVTMRGDEVIVTTVEHVSEGDVTATAMYEFDRHMRLLRKRHSDTYWDAHRRLELEGKLTHRRESCPERNGPPVFSVWTNGRWVDHR